METNQLIEIEKHLIQAEIVDQLEKLRVENELSHKELAEILGFQPSFLSQLYAANKFFNLNHLAKIQRFFDVKINFSFTRREDIRIARDPKRVKITDKITAGFDSTLHYDKTVEELTVSIGGED